MTTDFLNVKAGDPVTMEKWNQMVASARSSQLCLGGDNVRIRKLPHGSLINSRFVRTWVHPWRMTASFSHAMFHPGTINGMSPTIAAAQGRAVPINNNPPPALPMSSSEWDDQGFSWMVLELSFDPQDTSWREIKSVEIKQRANITREDKQHLDTPQLYLGYAGFNDSHTARYPLVRMQRVKSSTNKLAFNYWQVAMFNLQHKAVPPIPGQTSISRHYFWPA
jgi:hypothetical protein